MSHIIHIGFNVHVSKSNLMNLKTNSKGRIKIIYGRIMLYTGEWGLRSFKRRFYPICTPKKDLSLLLKRSFPSKPTYLQQNQYLSSKYAKLEFSNVRLKSVSKDFTGVCLF